MPSPPGDVRLARPDIWYQVYKVIHIRYKIVILGIGFKVRYKYIHCGAAWT
jgi:hypothetical protein